MAQLHANGRRLHYRAEGEGAPVIALHGSASTGAQWRSLVGYLSGRFEIFTPDLPGYGASDPVPAGGLAADAAAVTGLAARIGAPVHLVGHSWGAVVALQVARQQPALVRSLTLIEPVAFHLLRDGAPGDRAVLAEVEALQRGIDADAASGSPAAAMERFIDFWNGSGAWARTSPRLRAFFLGCLDRVRADFRAVAAERWSVADLGQVDVPALAVMGLGSPVAGMRMTELVARALPRAVLRLVPDAGHLAPLTDPHVVDPMIGAHLAAVDLAARRPAPAIAA
jgi:pimeloyl-ACP methyl ester carboxylesterase